MIEAGNMCVSDSFKIRTPGIFTENRRFIAQYVTVWNSVPCWWFGTFFSISYMGCHPSHWRTPSFFKMVKTCFYPPTRFFFGELNCHVANPISEIASHWAAVGCMEFNPYQSLILASADRSCGHGYPWRSPESGHHFCIVRLVSSYQ